MNETNIVLSDSELELSQGFDEWRTLDVSDRTPQFDYTSIRTFSRSVGADMGNTLYPVLDFIGNVWYDLYGLTEIITSALLLNDVSIDFAGCYVILAC